MVSDVRVLLRGHDVGPLLKQGVALWHLREGDRTTLLALAVGTVTERKCSYTSTTTATTIAPATSAAVAVDLVALA